MKTQWYNFTKSNAFKTNCKMFFIIEITLRFYGLKSIISSVALFFKILYILQMLKGCVYTTSCVPSCLNNRYDTTLQEK